MTKLPTECLLRGERHVHVHSNGVILGCRLFLSAVDIIARETGNELRPIQNQNGKQSQYSKCSPAPFTAITQMRNAITPAHLVSLGALI